MPCEIELIARLEAYRAGRAVPFASHRQLALKADAIVICPIAMAGEDTSVQVVAYGEIGQPRPTVWAVPDPRNRDHQYWLFARLGAWVEEYFQRCRQEKSYPQVIVAAGAAIEHLDTLADRLRYNRENATVRRFGELLSYSTERYPIAGQQTLIAVTDLLRRHWMTGQQPAEDAHLGALITWIEPPAGVSVFEAVAAAEQIPMGVKTDPAFDRDVLEPLVTAFNAARRAGTGREALRAQARQIQAVVEPVVLRIYEATQRAIGIYRRLELPELPDLNQLQRREAEEFASFLANRARGLPLRLRDSPKAAAFKLTEREDAVKTYGAVLRADRVQRAQALLDGRIVAGRVENPQRRVVSRQTELTFDLVSTQTSLRLRQRDSFCWVADPRLRVTVVDVRLAGSTTRISLRVVGGHRVVGLPAAGQFVEFVSGLPDWEWPRQQRNKLFKRLAVTPWTHVADGAPPLGLARPAPDDPLAAVEALK